LAYKLKLGGKKYQAAPCVQPVFRSLVMTKLRLTILTAIALSGCASQGSVDQQLGADNSLAAKQHLSVASICCTDFSSITMQQLHNGNLTIDATSQVMQFPSGRSAFYAGTIPAEFYGADVTAASIVAGSAMPMQILLLDAQRNPTRTLDESAFPYTEATLFSSNRFSGKFRLLPNERFMVVYANTADLQRKLTLPHPEKLKARAMNLVPAGEAPQIRPNTSNVVPRQQTGLISTQTQQYYQQAIQQAVKNNQIEQAMQLVAEAEKLGFNDARTIFVDAVKQK
jgi:maltose operon protein